MGISIDWEDYKKQLLTPSNTYEMISEYLTPYFPKRLYKYGNFNSNYWEKTIFKGEIYLAMSKSFNDPFDCLPHFDLDKLFNSSKFRKIVLSQKPHIHESDFFNLDRSYIKQKILQGLREDFRATCFSEIWDSILMWGHYADCHKGFCIEYDTSELSAIKKTKFFPVLYNKEQFDITHDLINNSPNVGLISIVGKAKEWEYEKEWRMITLSRDSQYQYYFRKEIKSVILGLNCDEDNIIKVLNWAKEYGKKVYQTQISSGKYKIIKEQIS